MCIISTSHARTHVPFDLLTRPRDGVRGIWPHDSLNSIRNPFFAWPPIWAAKDRELLAFCWAREWLAFLHKRTPAAIMWPTAGRSPENTEHSRLKASVRTHRIGCDVFNVILLRFSPHTKKTLAAVSCGGPITCYMCALLMSLRCGFHTRVCLCVRLGSPVPTDYQTIDLNEIRKHKTQPTK